MQPFLLVKLPDFKYYITNRRTIDVCVSFHSPYSAQENEANKFSLKNTPLGSTDPPISQAMPFRLIGIFAYPLEQFFLTRDFPIFSLSSSSSSSSSSVTGLAL